MRLKINANLVGNEEINAQERETFQNKGNLGLVKKYGGGGGGPEHLEMWLIKNT